MRLLVAFEEEYRAYQGAISSAIQVLRPGVEVEATGADALKEGLDRFAPQAVICSRPEGPDPDGRVAWIELPPEPDRTAVARLGDHRFELDNPSLETVLEVVDRAELLFRSDAKSPLT
ncbi:hypothetical protein GBA63_00275 [Rubrobacter tropicus]|uniref:Uncharacterized protein n=1 Tax=Rubrobacter tropicus TaxID=2653851 RepID=A0A6G8Q404_9ACTN|nr:hypothetical protein [Rubrobacter tropicus]QIN81224.1 hypothetical protein GBA63_00275 [Rubrobacter tropicus]